jgi:acyl carrier protein
MEVSALLQKIREEIARELEVPIETLSDSASLREAYGMDSVAAVTIVFRLENELGLEIDVKKLAGINTIDQLRVLIAKELFDKDRHCLKEHG